MRKAKLTVGLAVIDTNVETAVRDNDLHFARLHDKCQTRLGKPYYCPSCQVVVEPEHQVQAWPIDKDTMLPLDPSDMSSVQPERSGVIDLRKFVGSVELNDLIKRVPYWLAPAQDLQAKKGYAALWTAMVESGDIALGMTTLWGKEHPVSIEAREQGLVMWLLAQIDELTLPTFILPSLDEIAQQELAVKGGAATDSPEELVAMWSNQMQLFLTSQQGALAPTDFVRPARERLNALVQRKLKGQKIVPVVPTTPLASPDFMAAIRDSIKATPRKRAKVKV